MTIYINYISTSNFQSFKNSCYGRGVNIFNSNGTFSFVGSFLRVFLATSLFFLALNTHASNTIPIGELLDKNGKLHNPLKRSGAIDFSGFHLVIDECEGPLFLSTPPLASGWNTLGSGLNNVANAIAVSGNDVYVGGIFTTAGGSSANRIARWDGSSWSALGSGLNGDVYTIAVLGSDVYVGGDFTTAGGNSAIRIARWNGSSWSALSTGLNGAARAIAILGSDVYVGGEFTSAGGNSVNYIARWNGSSWSSLNTGLNGAAWSIGVSGSDVYVGGSFTAAGGSSANNIARWNGSSWSALASGLDNSVFAIALSGSDVYVGGSFTTAGGSSANRIARWNGSSWSALSSGLDNSVFAIAISGSNIYVGGAFVTAGGISANRFAQWNGSSWNALDSGLNNNASAIAISGSDVYVGGNFTTAGGSSANYIARWGEAIIPSISSFTPLSGSAGASVTITGTNFSTTPSSNLVRFGAIQATVTAASATQLTATVPAGASHSPITVKVGDRTAYSSQNFLPTFPPVKPEITPADFAPKVDFTTGTNPEVVAMADIDGDGKADMVIPNYNGNSVSVFRNTSITGTINTASFAAKADFTVGTNPYDVAIQDLDGDGKLDLAVSNSGSASVSVLRNTSSSGIISFSAKVDFATGTTPIFLDISDLDGDGKPDIVAANYGSATLSVLRNTSVVGSIISSSFAAKVDFTTGANPQQVTVGDLDGDGKPELVVTSYNTAKVSVMRNTATVGVINSGSFAARVDFTTGTQPLSVALGDIDGDGKLDMAVTNDGSVSISVFRNTSTLGTINAGSFTAKVDFGTASGSNCVRIGDIDGNGKPEMVSTNVSGNSVSIFRNIATSGTISSGSFEARDDLPTGSNAQSVAIGDIDGDGKPDLAVANYSGSSVSLFRNNPILFPTITSISPASGNVGTSVTIIGTNFSTTQANNLVRFGATQATVTAATATQLTMTVPTGAIHSPITVKVGDRSAYSSQNFLPTFPPVKAEITSADFMAKVDFTTGTNPFYAAMADLDGDGKPDVITPNSSGSTISVLRNTAAPGIINTGSLAPKVDFTAGTNVFAVATGDIDGDGKLDIAVLNNGSNSVSVYRNTSTVGSITNVSFAAKVDFSVSVLPRYLAIADIDGDGKPELVVGSSSDNNISILRNTSTSGSITSGSFAARVDFPAGNLTYGLVIRDFDGDGKADIAVADQGSYTVSVFRNTSSIGVINSASLSARVAFATGQEPVHLESGDIDGDGKIDLIVTNFIDQSISVLRNTSTVGSITSGSFAAKVDFAVGSNPRSIGIGDLNGDGKPDLAVTNSTSNTVSVLRNTSTTGTINAGSFATKVDILAGAGPFMAMMVDMDGDGKQDIVVSNNTGGTVSVFRNDPILFPTITSFTPISGQVGSTVTLTGTNFSTTPSSNQVRFGATQAIVTAATATQLIVTLPTGATFGPITVKVADRTAYSKLSFTPIFSPSKPNITSVDLMPKVDFAANTRPQAMAIGDIDGDGKSDLVVANTNGGNVSIYRNTSTIANINSNSLADKVDFATNLSPTSVAVGDLDGDGKMDIVVANYNGISISVLRNTSTPGSISFSPKVDFTTSTDPYFVAIADLDGDGKSDIVAANHFNGSGGNSVSIYRNTSVVGTINSNSFAPKIDFATGTSPAQIAIGDLDGDGKVDIATANYGAGANSISVLRNTSLPGEINAGSFATKVDFATGAFPKGVIVIDLDYDGKLDLISSNESGNNISVLRNISTSGIINSGSFSPKADFPTGTQPAWIGSGDMNGDAKSDLIIANAFDGTGGNSISILRNNSSTGNIALTQKLDIATGIKPYSVTIGDIDGDNKPDISVGYINNGSGGNIISVFRNNPSPIVTSPVVDTICAGAAINIGFTTAWSLNTGNIFTAQLSNATGSFASPVNIGTLSGISSGNINATIPANTALGSGYRVRVVASVPVYSSPDNGANIFINTLPFTPSSITGNTTVLLGSTYTYSTPAIVNATSYQWTYTGTGVTITGNGASVTVAYSVNSSAGNLRVAGINSCGIGIFYSIPISIYPNPAFLGFELVKDVNTGTSSASPGDLTKVGNALFFTATEGATGRELYMTTGITAGTDIVKNINPGANSAFQASGNFLTEFNGNLVFAATENATGKELWKSNGTTSGTTIINDAVPGTGSSNPSHLVSSATNVYFNTNFPATGNELYTSNGTSTVTLVSDVCPGTCNGLSPSGAPISKIGDYLFFAANNGTDGTEPWYYNLTNNQIGILTNISSASSDPATFTELNGAIFFSAKTDAEGNELIKYTTSYQVIKDVRPGTAGSLPKQLTPAKPLTTQKDALFFVADDGSSGQELWVSMFNTNSNVPDSTYRVKDILPGTGSSQIQGLYYLGGVLLFAANDGANGKELWVSKGKDSTTYILKDINCGAGSSNPSGFTFLNGWVYFTADDGINGAELWRTDGTAGGTSLVGDLRLGSQGSTPTGLTVLNNILFFAADDGNVGVELWKYNPINTRNVLAGPSPTTNLCPGVTIPISYNIAGTFNAGNIFTIQLSGSNGCFDNPINMGTLLSNTAGTINATVPSNLAGGNQYRFRIVSSDPPSIPIESPTKLTAKFFPTPTAVIYGNQHVSPGQNSLAYNVPIISNASSYVWSYSGTGVTISGSGTGITLSFAFNATSGNLSCAGINDCGLGQASVLPIFVSSLSNQTVGRWDIIPSFANIARDGAVSLTIGEKAYIGGGKTGNTYLNDFWEYNPNTNTWMQKANLPGGAREEAVGFSIGNRGFVGAGYSGTTANADFWEYNPTTNTWTQKADIPGNGRWSAVGFSIQNKGYVGTGKKGSFSSPTYNDDFYQYDPVANQWIAIPNNIPGVREGAVGFSIGNTGYVGLGYNGSNYLGDFYSFNPATQAWTALPAFPGPARKDAFGLYMANHAFVGTGNQGTTYFRDFWEFNPVTGWKARQNIGAQGRSRSTSFSVGSQLWAGTGHEGTNSLGDYLKFTPSFINDEPQDAVVVPISAGSDCGLSLLGSTQFATQTLPACTSGQFADDDVWYKFTATATVHVLRIFNFTSPLAFEIFSGTPGNFTTITCSPSVGNMFVMNNLNIGEQYHIRIYTAANSLFSDFSICIDSNPVQAVNDECLSATILPVSNNLNCTPTTYNTSQATQSIAACLANTTADDDVWFKFTATSTVQLLTVQDVTPIPSYANSGNLIVELMSGTCTSMTSLECSEALDNSLSTKILSGLNVGSTYFLRCYSASNTGYLSFKMCLSTPPTAPANDACANTTSIPVNPGYFCEQSVSGTTLGASSVWGNNGCPADDTFDEVWYSFTATWTSHVVSFGNVAVAFGNNTSANQVMGAQLYNTTCTSGGFIACAGLISNNKYQFNNLTPGTNYRLRVFTKQTGIYANFDVCVLTTPPAPENDACTGAFTLPVNETLTCSDFLAGTTYYASHATVPGACGAATSDVWYKFTATQADYVLTLKNIRGAEFGAIGASLTVQLLSGNCATLTPLSCKTDSVFFVSGLTNASSYYVRVVLPQVNNLGEDFANFDICLSKVPAPPTNDECAGAALLSVSNQAYCTTAIEGTTKGATRSLADCNGKVSDDDVWYKFVATGTDQVVSIYGTGYVKGSGNIWFEAFGGGACNSLNSIVCAKEGIKRLNGLTVGSTYFIRIFTEAPNSYQQFRICLSTPPVNDVCNSAVVLTLNSNPQGCQNPVEQGSTLGADLSSGDNCNLMDARDVWYQFFATSTKHIISVYDVQRQVVSETGSNQLQFAVFTGDCVSLAPVGCQQAGNFLVVDNLVVGQNVKIKVFSPSDKGYSFKVCISQEPSIQTNNNCITAQSVTVDPTNTCPSPLTGSTYTTIPSNNATETGCTYSGVGLDGVTWYKFTATGSVHSIKVMDIQGQTGSAAPIYHQVYSGNCATGLNTLNCLSDLDSSRYDNLVAGQTYFFKVGKLQSFSGLSTFKVCVSVPSTTASNNNCNASTLLSVNGAWVSGNSLLGTQSLPSCASDNSANDDLWYRFVATGTMHHIEISNIVPNGGSEVKMVREIFGGSSCVSLLSLNCSEDDFVAEGLVPGATYYIRAYTKGDKVSATYQIRVRPVSTPPANDLCSGSITLPANAGLNYTNTASGTTVAATQSLSPCLGLKAEDVWYKFTATGTIASIQVVPQVGYANTQEIVQQVFSGTCSNLTSIAGCIESTNAFVTGLSPGATYYVRVYEKTGRNSFQFNIGLIQYPANASNDNCAAATTVPINSGSTCSTVLRGTTVGASATSSSDCTSGIFCDDVFYKFTATASAHLVSIQNISPLTATSSLDSLGFISYSACVSVPLNIHTKKALLTGLTIGTTYYIRVGSKGLGGKYNYDICITTPPVPANDGCATAQVIMANTSSTCSNSYTGSTLLATNGPTSCLGGNAKDVWYRFQATANSHMVNLSGVTAQIGTDFNLVHQVYSGICTALNSLKCSAADTSLLTGLTIGNDYYIRVYSRDTLSSGTFSLCVNTPQTVASNDGCPNAVNVSVNTNTICTQFVNGFTLGGTQSLPGCNGSADDDIWFKFTALSTAHDISIFDKQLFDVTASNQSLILEVFSDDCSANPISLVCSATEQATVSNLIPGNTYHIRVYTAAASGSAMFKLCIKTLHLPNPPINDQRANATNLVQQQEAACSQGYRTWGSFYYATTESFSVCQGNAAYDVWYKFVALGTEVSIEVNGRTDLVAEVWHDTPLQLRNCLNNNTTTNSEAITLTGLMPGGTYHVRVYPYAISNNAPASVYNLENSTFSICIYGDDISPEVLESPTISPFLTQNIASGYTPGNFSSTETGAAIYSIPMAIPSGTGGMQPDVSLVYSSQGGNGLLGVGWSLTGFSVISRSSKTIAQDGQKKGIDYSASDRYVLDGEKLVNVTSQAYGSDACEYRTEQQSFKRIRSYGNVNGSGTPEKFKVWTKDGMLYEYGYSADSRIEVQGRHEVLYWLVNKITDTKGNYIRYYYEEDAVNGTYYPMKIEYTGNDNTGLAPYCRVEFGYEARSDVGESFKYGSLTKVRKRLNKVTAYYESQKAREYSFSYQQGAYDQVSMLTTIQECGLDGKCFTPTTFQWQNGDLFFEKQPNVISNMFPIEILGNNNALFREADFNGDGLTDLFTYDFTTQQSKLYRNDGNYNFTDTTKTGIITLSSNEVFDFVDFNSDGFSDFYVQDTVTGNTRWLAHNRSLSFAGLAYVLTTNKIPASVLQKTTLAGIKRVQFMDINGDGSSDALVRASIDNSFLSIYLNTNAGNFSANVGTIPASLFAGDYELLDYDGDGLTDVMTINKTTRENKWYHNESTQTPQAINFVLKRTNALSTAVLPNNPIFKTGDWNGDGVTDIAVYGAQVSGPSTTYTEIQWYINKGNLFFKTISNAMSPSISGTYGASDLFFVPYDMNGDGKDDVLNYRYSSGELRIYLNDGMGKFSNSFAGISLTNLINPQLLKGGAGIRPVSYRHGNVFSLFWWNPANGQNRVVDLQLDFNYGRVDKITNGLGQIVAIRYDELTNDSIYQRSNTSLYPEHDFFGGYKVVSEYCINNADGDTTRVQNRFKKGKMNLQGRGFRGYEEVETIDITKGIRSCSFRDADTRYLSAPVKLSQIYQPNGKLLHETEQLNVIDSIINPTFPTEKIYWSYSREIVQRNFELNGQLVSTIRKRQQIDMNGNSLYSVVDYGGGVMDSTTFTYSDDVDKWFLGRMTGTKIYRILPGKPTSVRTVGFEYDLMTGLKTKEIFEPDSSDVNKIVKMYYFDGYGNITSSSTTAWNGTAPATRNSYSTYDTKGRFSIHTHNDLGHATNYVYHNIFGMPLSETDLNGLTETYLYDGFGRVTQETQPDGNWTKYRYYKCPDGTCPEGALYYILQEYSIGTPDKVYLDLLNRPVVQEDIGFSGTPTFQVTRYNKRGQVEQSSDPYYLNEPILWTTYEYDILDRTVKVTSPGNIIGRMEYNGLANTVYNPLGQHKTEVKSSDGRLLSVTDNVGKSITYDYDALRNMTRITDSKGNHIDFEYDFHNYKKKMTDPDMGVYQYQYNRFGELTKQTYPDGQMTTMAYDTLGRLLSRTEPEGVAKWKYDTKPHGVGMLDSISYNTFSQAVYYDDLSRLKTDRRKINGQIYDYTYDYDAQGRMSVMNYPMGFSIKNVFNEWNMLSEIRNAATTDLYYKVDELNSYGQPLQTTYGNGVKTEYDFDPSKRWLRGIYASKDANIIQNVSFTYDDLANVRSKTNQRLGYTELYGYDQLNRLTGYNIDGVNSTTLQYDELGNITYKSDVGTYHYGENGQGPHQLSRLEGNAGVCIPSANAQFQYTSYNMVKQMENDSMSLTIEYGASRERTYQKMYKEGVLQQEKIYAGEGLEIVTDSTGIKKMFYVRGFNGVLMVHNVKNETNIQDHYWHRDNQDNLQAISNAAGVLIEELSYDPWGKRRNIDGSPTDTLITTTYERGYTGHEHYDFLGLVNMNGRIQDPVLGRFISPDPYVHDITNLQNLNRYSYVVNNPMTLTDPSGFGLSIGSITRPFKAVAKVVAKPLAAVANKVGNITGVNLRDPASIAVLSLGPIGLVLNKQITKAVNDFGSKAFGQSTWNTIKVTAAIIAVTVATGGSGLALSTTFSGAAVGFSGAYFGAGVAGASYEDAFSSGLYGAAQGAVTAHFASKIGAATNDFSSFSQQVGKTVGHGLLQGVMSKADGGSFESGFVSGAFSGASESLANYFQVAPGSAGSMLFGGVVGGTGSVVGGGKFQNGAIAGVMTYAFNYGGGSINKESNEWVEGMDKMIMANDENLEIKRDFSTTVNKNNNQSPWHNGSKGVAAADFRTNPRGFSVEKSSEIARKMSASTGAFCQYEHVQNGVQTNYSYFNGQKVINNKTGADGSHIHCDMRSKYGN